jgi:hypothetical protein
MTFPTSQVSNDNDLSFSLDSTIGIGRVGPFVVNNNTRFELLADWINFKLSMNRTGDNGATWERCDQAHEVSIANDVGSPSPKQYQNIAGCYDVAGGRIFAVYFDSVTFTIGIVPFTIATKKWGTPVVSTIGYTVSTSFCDDPMIACEYRPSDDSVWMLFTQEDAGVPIESQKIFGAKYSATPATWGVSVQRIGSVPGTFRNYRLASMVLNPANNKIRVFGTVDPRNPAPSINGLLWMVTLDTADNFSAEGTVNLGTKTTNFDEVSQAKIVNGVVGFTYIIGARGAGQFVTHVVRATDADAPVWDDATPGPMQIPLLNGGLVTPMAFFIDSVAGTQYVSYSYLTNAGNKATFAYITSAGLGQPWDAVQTVIIAGFDNSGPVGVGGAQFGEYNNGLVLSFPYGNNFGMGWFENVAAPPPPAPANVPSRIASQLLTTLTLPDPKIHCNFGTQMRCTVKRGGRVYEMQSGKVVSFVSH